MTDEHRCTDCGGAFKSADALRDHENAKHYVAPKKPFLDFKKHKGKVLVLVVLVVLSGGMLYLFSQGGSGAGAVSYPPKLSNAPIHWHSQLEIFVDGKPVPIPVNIGIGVRHEPLHTHEPDGVIHVESPDTRDYTLGNFFAVWGTRLDAKCVGQYCGRVEMTVDGSASDQFGELLLRDGQQIVLKVTT
ncbi:hypothetical protein HY572_06090 [Candidatus Micrarchaeota archaeon]|nr:hypothetical protein [Candidatus Micrarchaeota archaeon]